MKLRDLSRRIRTDDQPDFAHVLQGGQDLSELTAECLAEFPDTIFITNSQGRVFGKVQKETLLYLLERQRGFRFEQILDSMNDGVVAVDTSGRIFYANPAYVSVLGVPLRRIMGRLIQEVEPGSLLGRTLVERTPLTNEKQLIASIKKNVSLRTFPLWDGEMFLGAVSIFRDVTRLHQLNQEMQQMSGIVDAYSQQIHSQETAEKLGIASYNKALRTTIQKAATVALTDVPLLICGESGTGKNAMARYLHQCSGRRGKPLIVVNCAAVPANMIEAELFGGDGQQHPGKVALADGGTLFLDEIEELPLSAQTRLLYLLQRDNPISSEDGTTSIPDVRLIASTSQTLEPLVREKRFRKELFFRLNTITVNLPPLRERRDDIIPMANRFLSECNEKYHRNVAFSSQAYQEMQHYSWPGNLRELKSYVERVVILADDSLPILEPAEDSTAGNDQSIRAFIRNNQPLDQQVQLFETEVIRQALEAFGGNRTAAMKQLGISRRTFYRKCAELGVFICSEK